jgi:hypothetical protein
MQPFPRELRCHLMAGPHLGHLEMTPFSSKTLMIS